jgi:hypothetical protein
MVTRVIAGIAWSLTTGLAGGFLLLSPWALGEQPSGDWSNVTRTQFWTGAGLVALGVVGLVMVAAQLARLMRGSDAARVPARARPAGAAPNGEMDAALVALANALVADLNRQPAAPAPPPQYAPLPPRPQTYPPQAAPPPGGPAYAPAPAPQAPQAPQQPQPPPQAGEPWRTR